MQKLIRSGLFLSSVGRGLRNFGSGSVRVETSKGARSITIDRGVKEQVDSSKSLAEVLGNKILEESSQNIGVVSGDNAGGYINWYKSYHGLGSKPFESRVQEVLLQCLYPLDIEIKPDGLLYLPEIKYRRILNKAFGAGGWGLVPRSDTRVTPTLVTREYGLICHGQLVSVARGEQDYFNVTGIPTATEGCKSNALMRCCKDLGIGSELWDPVFIKQFKNTQCVERFVEHVVTKKKKKIWLRKGREVEYPFKVTSYSSY